MVIVHASLFSGIGGFDLAADWAGWENAFHCEINPFGRKILKYYWPNAISYDDITKTDFTIWRGRIDVLTGGFPCQPFSLAGKRLGTADYRNLWPEYHRAIKEIQPTWVIGENVPGLLNWSGGLVFEQVQTDLENEGYEVWPVILPACSVDAPHRRERVWFVAYSRLFRQAKRQRQAMGASQLCQEQSTPNATSNRWEREREGIKTEKRLQPRPEPDWELAGRPERLCNFGITPDPDSQRQQKRDNARQPKESGRINKMFSSPQNWQNFPTQSPVCGGDDGIQPQSHGVAISENRNNMDRNIVIKLCIDEGRMKVDFNTGKIYSLKHRGKEGQEIELLGADCNGYIVHGIRYNGFKIQLRAHQIVWIAANGLYDKSALMIDHINRNKKDNRLENLRLVDAKGNRENSTEYKGKFTDEQKDMMVWLHKEDSIPMREIAENYGISKSRVQQIISEHSGIYGITFSKWRNESIKAYGNAIVPQVAYRIFKAINEYEKI